MLDVAKVRAMLKGRGGLDSALAESPVAGDSAILSFANVLVRGDSSVFELEVSAFDNDGLLLFEGSQQITVKPGTNQPAAPVLAYSAPDASVATILLSPQPVDLEWAGAIPGDLSCLNRNPSETAHAQQQLSVVGKDASNASVPGVRVGWTSRDTSVVTVDSVGLLHARCANKSTWVVARTFLDKSDSVLVNVTAPPFALVMSPESTAVSRDEDVQLTAHYVDESGNAIATSSVTWKSSDTSRATVDANGLVHGLTNGRVIVSARSGSRETVGIVQVTRPVAVRVDVSPAGDSVAVKHTRILAAAAYDRFDRRIPDPGQFTWMSLNGDVAAVTGDGLVGGVAAGDARVVASLDGAADTAAIKVVDAVTGGVTARVIDAATGAPISGAFVSAASNPNAPTTTDASGYFTLLRVPPGDDISIVADLYAATAQYALPVVVAQTKRLQDIPLAIAGGSGDLTGTVIDALDDSPVSRATVKLFAGIYPRASDPSSGTVDPPAVAETTTGADGTFSFVRMTSGTYTYAVEAPGYSFTRTVAVVVSSSSRDSRIPLSPQLAGNALRVVLTWGDCNADAGVPCDLDAHMTGPASAPDTGRFHVAYFQRSYVTGGMSVATLDNDATSGLGPETITLKPVLGGVYKFYVHDYSSGFDTTSTRLSTTSHVRVDVYQNGALLASFTPPRDGLGTIWAVFQYDGSTVVPLDRMIGVADFRQVGSDFLRAGPTSALDNDARAVIRDLRGAPAKQR